MSKNDKLDYDFYKIRNETLEEGRAKLHKKLRELSEEREKEILEVINSYTIHSDGILIQTIAKLLNLNRKSITPYIKSLTKQGRIKRSETNGKVVSTSNVFEDPIINAEVFGFYFRSRLLNNKWNKNFVLNEDIKYVFSNDPNDEKNTKKSHIYDFTSFRKFYEPKFTEKDIIEKMLFEFSNKIGSFIAYLIIYSMNPDNYHNNDLSSLSDKEKDEVVKEIINRGILSIIPFLVRSFKETFDQIIGNYPFFDVEAQKKYYSQFPKFIIDDKKVFLSLINAFTELYPLMSYEFEKIMSKQNRYIFKDSLINQPSGIEAYKTYLKEFYEHLKKQENCNHEYEKKLKTDYYQCKICNHMIKSKKIKPD